MLYCWLTDRIEVQHFIINSVQLLLILVSLMHCMVILVRTLCLKNQP